MTPEQPNNYYIKPTNSTRNFQDFLRQHRALTIILTAFFIVFFILIFFLATHKSEDNEYANRVPERAPYATFEHEYLIEYSAQDALSEEILYELRVILLNAEELASAPTDNSGEQQYIVSVDEDSYQVSEIPTIKNGELYTMNLNVSDGRKYTLQLLINNTYHEEYAAAILQRTDTSNSQDYIITFTSNTDEYYSNLGTDNAETGNGSENTSMIVDHLTGNPLNPLPDSALEWINTLNLTNNPQTIYSTLPSLR